MGRWYETSSQRAGDEGFIFFAWTSHSTKNWVDSNLRCHGAHAPLWRWSFCWGFDHAKLIIFTMGLIHQECFKSRSPVNSPHKGQWRGALRCSLIYTRINGWVNNREAGDLRRHRTHYDVVVMEPILTNQHWGPMPFAQWQSCWKCLGFLWLNIYLNTKHIKLQ